MSREFLFSYSATLNTGQNLIGDLIGNVEGTLNKSALEQVRALVVSKTADLGRTIVGPVSITFIYELNK